MNATPGSRTPAAIGISSRYPAADARGLTADLDRHIVRVSILARDLAAVGSSSRDPATTDRVHDLADTLAYARDLARDLARGATALDLALDLALHLALDLARTLAYARDLARDLADTITYARDFAAALARTHDIGRDLADYLEGSRDGQARRGIRSRSGPGRVVPAAGKLVAAAALLLPTRDRARYAEEFLSELREIAHAGGSRRAQLAYAAWQVLAARRLRAGLRVPRRRGAAP